MRAASKIAFLASDSEIAQEALVKLGAAYGAVPLDEAGVIVALGGDGFMLNTLHGTQARNLPVYGMNCGTIGFLMNEYAEEGLIERLEAAAEEVINPLAMRAVTTDGRVHEALAINEVSLLRAGPQAAKLKITIDGKVRMEELVCDGALVSTPAGSTAYNYSAHGPILPIGADLLALTPISAFRPRRWKGALLSHDAIVRFEALSSDIRPVSAVADNLEVRNAVSVEARENRDISMTLLFDRGQSLDERILREQFDY